MSAFTKKGGSAADRTAAEDVADAADEATQLHGDQPASEESWETVLQLAVAKWPSTRKHESLLDDLRFNEERKVFTATFFAGASFIDGQRSILEFLAVQRLDRSASP